MFFTPKDRDNLQAIKTLLVGLAHALAEHDTYAKKLNEGLPAQRQRNDEVCQRFNQATAEYQKLSAELIELMRGKPPKKKDEQAGTWIMKAIWTKPKKPRRRAQKARQCN